jgi:hypothetical protein
VVIAWIYCSALLLYFAAELTRVYARTLGSNATERTQPMLEFVWPRKANPQWRHSFVSTGFRLTIFRE